MTDLPRHPTTGVHYAHVVPSNWGAHVDIHAMWTKFAGKFNWISVHRPDGIVNADGTSEILQDPTVLLVIWGGVPVVPPRSERQAHTALVYSEAIGDRSKMLFDHRRDLDFFDAAVAQGQYDAVFCHTPWMVDQFKTKGVRSFLLPLGWDQDVYGTPRFEGPRLHDYVYYGSIVGKRAMVMPFLKQQLGEKLFDASGLFGRSIVAKLDVARASLYVAHSDVDSFSTWRTWQTLGSSACLVAEPADSWPLVAGRHFIQIARVDWVNAALVAADLVRMLGEVDYLSVARMAYEEIAKHYTSERCIEEYLVPAGGEICGS